MIDQRKEPKKAMRYDSLNAYDHALDDLRSAPNDRRAQHQAVLALARAGSTDFALAEYFRYGLHLIDDDEDIMALLGRLYKDKFLASFVANQDSQIELEWIGKAVDAYLKAFERTNGIYSGVNAATMKLMNEEGRDSILAVIEKVSSQLDIQKDLSKHDRYFAFSTHAELHLLKGDFRACIQNLKAAISHDPQNYTAHASTLRQFNNICQKKDVKQGVRDQIQQTLAPPSSAIFTGHLFTSDISPPTGTDVLSAEQILELKTTLSDIIQKNDIGFGFGSLAAGSDIIMAEALLEEGCELHIYLPISHDIFVEKSVKPYGDHWLKRFEKCIANAQYVRELFDRRCWYNDILDRFSWQVAMGAAIRKSKELSSHAVHLTIWDGQRTSTGTSASIEDWQQTGHKNCAITFPQKRAKKSLNKKARKLPLRFSLKSVRDNKTTYFETVQEVLDAACATMQEQTEAVLYIDVSVHDQSNDDYILPQPQTDSIKIPNCIWLSEEASLLYQLNTAAHREMTFAGTSENDARLYTLNF